MTDKNNKNNNKNNTKTFDIKHVLLNCLFL